MTSIDTLQPVFTLRTETRFASFFAYWPRYTTTIDYRMHPEQIIEIVTAEILPHGSDTPVSIASASYLQLAIHYRAEILADWASRQPSSSPTSQRSESETTALAWIIGVEARYKSPGLRKFGLMQCDHPEFDIDAITLDQACALLSAQYWHANGLDRLPGLLALWTFDHIIDSGSPRNAARHLQASIGALQSGRIDEQTITTAARAEIRSAAHDLAVRRLSDNPLTESIHRVLDLIEYARASYPSEPTK